MFVYFVSYSTQVRKVIIYIYIITFLYIYIYSPLKGCYFTLCRKKVPPPPPERSQYFKRKCQNIAGPLLTNAGLTPTSDVSAVSLSDISCENLRYEDGMGSRDLASL
jgi:hypothetical protein